MQLSDPLRCSSEGASLDWRTARRYAGGAENQPEEALRGRDERTASAGIRSSLTSPVAAYALGGVLGGSAAAVLVVGITEMIKAMLTVVSGQDTWVLILAPLLGLGLSVLVLYGFGLSSETHTPGQPRWAAAWRAFPPGAVRADLTGDIVEFAGQEERFPWRLAPIRLVAIYATVGGGRRWGPRSPQPISESLRERLSEIAGGAGFCDRQA
jgi:hypothetical protein